MDQETSIIPQPTRGEPREIDILVIAKGLWKDRKLILKTILIAAVAGLLFALFTPPEYTARTTMVPQSSKSVTKLGGLSSLAAMAGFNLDLAGGTETLSPLVYPQIVNSVPFQLELMNTPFSFSEVDHPVSLYEYYMEIEKPDIFTLISKYTIELPGQLMLAIKGDKAKNKKTNPNDPISLTRKQEKMRKIMAAKVSLSVEELGYLSLQASFHEAFLSAQVANQARELLQNYITRYKIKKATDQLSFVEERYREKKKDFEKVQELLAIFRDQNKNVSSALVATQEDRLQSEYTIALNVYNELAKQLEQAKIQVKEETPVFSVLEPAIVPQLRTKPKRAMIMVIWLFVGIVTGIGIVFGKQYMTNVHKKWKETI
jgi:capsular polysaccharide biosynthesis protein